MSILYNKATKVQMFQTKGKVPIKAPWEVNASNVTSLNDSGSVFTEIYDPTKTPQDARLQVTEMPLHYMANPNHIVGDFIDGSQDLLNMPQENRPNFFGTSRKAANQYRAADGNLTEKLKIGLGIAPSAALNVGLAMVGVPTGAKGVLPVANELINPVAGIPSLIKGITRKILPKKIAAVADSQPKLISATPGLTQAQKKQAVEDLTIQINKNKTPTKLDSNVIEGTVTNAMGKEIPISTANKAKLSLIEDMERMANNMDMPEGLRRASQRRADELKKTLNTPPTKKVMGHELPNFGKKKGIMMDHDFDEEVYTASLNEGQKYAAPQIQRYNKIKNDIAEGNSWLYSNAEQELADAADIMEQTVNLGQNMYLSKYLAEAAKKSGGIKPPVAMTGYFDNIHNVVAPRLKQEQLGVVKNPADFTRFMDNVHYNRNGGILYKK